VVREVNFEVEKRISATCLDGGIISRNEHTTNQPTLGMI
jgi:hypothetical protein